MGEHSIRSRQEAEYIYTMAPIYDMRTGQFLFNYLRHEIAEVVRDTEFDTFYENLSLEDIVEWLDDHIIYDKTGRMIRAFDNYGVLWEDKRVA